MDTTIQVRIESEKKQELETVAHERGMNLSNLVRFWLFEKLTEIKKQKSE